MTRVIVLLIFMASLFVQQTMYSQSSDNVYQSIPEERVFVHHNTAFLFTGEYLYYKMYCLDSKSKKLSSLSKMGYVELVNEKKEVIFRHKIKLEKGQGQGDFFIPVSLPSGNYKLIGYTQWMKNFGVSVFYQGDMAIVNPYQGDQKAVLADSVSGSGISPSKEALITKNTSGLDLITNKKEFDKREQVSLLIKRKNGMLSSGSYSLSVRKLDTISIPQKNTALDTYQALSRSGSLKENSGEIVLPELRGELICGRIESKETNYSVEKQKIGFSVPGQDYDIKVTTTDKEGNFCFNLDKKYAEDNGYIQVLGNENQYDITLQPANSLDYKDLKFDRFQITKAMKDMIVKRSVYNQIRNRYFSVKPDTLYPAKEIAPFYGSDVDIYDLDAYTRFPTIRETFVEVIENVWIKKINDEKYVFQVRYKHPPYNEPQHLPLVIMDGMLIQDHTDLVELDARRVKRISVSRDKHYLGSLLFQGIVDIETEKGDYYQSMAKSYIQKVPLFKPLQKKKYFQQAYKNGVQDSRTRIPDFRNQLLWHPEIALQEEETKIDFFTSNNTGTFEIVLEGYSDQGTPVSVRERFTVK